MARAERRLAAIMFTDMVGYTSLSQRNETLALKLLEEQRRLLRPFFPKHNGKEIKTMGDAFLVEFASALEATRCAFDIQQSLHELNSQRISEKRIMVRIGVHVGDVVCDRGDIHGDAVNIASRMEPLAEPGGVCISEQVYDQVRNKFEFPLVRLEKRTLKNVDLPIDVYRLVMPWEEKMKETVELDRLKIAVLPLTNMSPDPNDEYFADGMTEELISTISNVSGLSVISRTSVMQYKKPGQKLTDIGEDLRVGTILEGSVRKFGNKVRVAVQLIEVMEDKHLWAQNYDRNLDDVFAVQSDIAQRVAESMRVRLLEDEKARIEKVPTKNMSAYESYLRGLYLMHRMTASSMEDSMKHLEDAFRQDPNFSSAHATLGNLYVMLAGETIPPREAFNKAEPLIAKALELDENSSDAHLAKGNLALQHHLDYELAEGEMKKSIDLNPSSAFAHFWYSFFLTVTGNLDAASKEGRRAHELDPLSPLMQFAICRCLILKRDYAEAIVLDERVLQAEPENVLIHLGLARTYTLAGRLEEAEREVEAAQRLKIKTLYAKTRLALDLALLGKREEAREVLHEIEAERQTHYFNLSDLASVYSELGEKDRALELLEEDFEEAPVSFLFRYQYPEFDPLREDSRFVSLQAGLHLPKKSSN